MGRGEGAGRRHTGPTAETSPGLGGVRSINGLEIRRYLQIEHGVKVATTGHKYPVDPAAVRDAIARRETTREAADEPDGAA